MAFGVTAKLIIWHNCHTAKRHRKQVGGEQAMRQIEFTEEELQQLANGSVHHGHVIVRRRMQALLLKSQRLPHQEIAKAMGISPTTMRHYFDLFLEGRVEGLTRLGYKGKRNLLMERKDEIIRTIEANPPTTYQEAQAQIKEATGLQRSLPQVREFLKKTGLRAVK